jgi:hypothetical protein
MRKYRHRFRIGWISGARAERSRQSPQPSPSSERGPTTASVDGCDCVTERPEVLFAVNCRRVTDTRCSADRF